jgi:hypothetical protein
MTGALVVAGAITLLLVWLLFMLRGTGPDN